MERLNKMLEAAEAKMVATKQVYQTFEDGKFQVYVTPVDQRTRAMKAHFRVGYYMEVAGSWKRTNKATFLQAMEAENYDHCQE